MARKAIVVKQQRLLKTKAKYDAIKADMKNMSWEEKYKLYKKYKGQTKYYNRCRVCWRIHSYVRELGLCRVCIRTYWRKWELMGIRKSSW